MKYLILEDNERRRERFNHYLDEWNVITLQFCFTADKAIECLQREKYDVIFLDHDLGGENFVESSRDDTGAGVARWMATTSYVGRETDVIIHSMNPRGALEMEQTLQAAGFTMVRKQPFAALLRFWKTLE